MILGLLTPASRPDQPSTVKTSRKLWMQHRSQQQLNTTCLFYHLELNHAAEERSGHGSKGERK